MKGLEEVVFVSELMFQVNIANRAAGRLQEEKQNSDTINIWSSIQLILIATANVSKILWPPTNKYIDRGKRLRTSLGIEEENILSDRRFRNHFEHYDERIEDWFKSQPSAVYTDLVMNPALRMQGSRLTNVHRGYNSFNNLVVFRGELLDLNLILGELEKLSLRCRKYFHS